MRHITEKHNRKKKRGKHLSQPGLDTMQLSFEFSISKPHKMIVDKLNVSCSWKFLVVEFLFENKEHLRMKFRI